MKIYKREIKPYIEPPMLQGFSCRPQPIEGYDWVSEDMEEELKNKIVLTDSWSKLIFKERYSVIGDGIIGNYEEIPIYVNK